MFPSPVHVKNLYDNFLSVTLKGRERKGIEVADLSAPETGLSLVCRRSVAGLSSASLQSVTNCRLIETYGVKPIESPQCMVAGKYSNQVRFKSH